MNLQFRKRIVPALAIFIIALVLFVLPRIGTPLEASTLYDACSRLAASSPAKALTLAHEWRTSRPDSVAAKHCEAVALFATGDYANAASAFAALVKEVQGAKPSLAGRLLIQEARAHEAAGQYNAATSDVSSALALDPGNPEARTQRDAIAKEEAANARATGAGHK